MNSDANVCNFDDWSSRNSRRDWLDRSKSNLIGSVKTTHGLGQTYDHEVRDLTENKSHFESMRPMMLYIVHCIIGLIVNTA
jgi:hypothetical protein